MYSFDFFFQIGRVDYGNFHLIIRPFYIPVSLLPLFITLSSLYSWIIQEDMRIKPKNYIL